MVVQTAPANPENSTIRHVVILGGTSGIGFALAEYYLQQGCRVIVCGRNTSKVSDDIVFRYPNLTMYELDVIKREQVNDFFSTLQTLHLDLFIYSAGYYFNERKRTLTKQESEQMLAVNLTGFQQCFQLASDIMQKQKVGHLVTIASVAGTLRQANASLYGRLKRNMIDTAVCYRHALEQHNVRVSVVAPGYINTEKLRSLNNGDASHKPFLLSEKDAVKEIVFAIENDLALHVFPKAMQHLVFFVNGLMCCLPEKIANWLLSKRR